MPLDLDTLFPPAPQRQLKVDSRAFNTVRVRDENGRRSAADSIIPTRWRAICTLELRGHDKKDIAEAMGMQYRTIIQITRRPSYIAMRDKLLAEMDSEFIAMKPLALSALKGGLMSRDEQTALRASDQWFKAAGFGGYSREPQPDRTVTAEDVARQLLVGVNVTVNVEK